jgi:tartrate dehydratase beta subunit/fumarate hydratase class I family protein
MVPKICQPKKSQGSNMYSGSELGMEATQRIAVEDFPGLRIIGDKGNDFFKELNLG